VGGGTGAEGVLSEQAWTMQWTRQPEQANSAEIKARNRWNRYFLLNLSYHARIRVNPPDLKIFLFCLF
jgi:hypothetical protein